MVARRLLDNIGKRHTAVIGQTRSGKTYATRFILKKLQTQGIHTIFFDPKHDDDYADLGVICYTQDYLPTKPGEEQEVWRIDACHKFDFRGIKNAGI